ncbi:hypothetical protein RJT34_24262 [Clitoria ternatea]|uniref:RING-type E3 ubiquitin transferase n=1 Tax=Clitoria ternatea TaxID=43366 RepID=A0AAN9FQC8_CLITE
MLVTSFFLMGYYIFVIKCCLNWQDHNRVDHIRRLSILRQGEDPSASYSTASEPRGLEEAVIRLIPVINYKPEKEEVGERRSFCSSECAVCLNEFQEDEKLRVIPNCGHVFHIDCIDVWLQNNAHCPLCRRTISLMTNQVVVNELIITPRPSPQDQSQNTENIIGAHEDFVVIDLDGEEHDGRDQINLQDRELLPTTTEGSIGVASQRKLFEQRIVHKKEKKLHKVTSLGDECIGVGANDERFTVQTMRRSFSMGSLMNTQFYVQVQQALQQQNGHGSEVSTIEACGGSGNGRVKRSFFSFGHGSRSRNVVSVNLES